MAFNDPLVRLGDYVEACLGKMLDAQKNRGAFQPYLGNSNVRWGAFDLQDLAVMRFEQQEEERYGLRDGDLVVCEGGEPGRCAIWQGEVPNMKIQKALHRIRVKDGLDNYFLYYWFLHAGKTGALEPYFTGTTIKHLTGKALAELKVPLPPIDRQRGLAKVLRSLDYKINLNLRINQTLEAMAQAIFKSWFVDFDPVKAKIAAIEQGEDPLRAAMRAISGKTDAELDQMPREYHNQLATTAELFPDAMEESELGDIPKGWEVGAFKQCCLRVESGGTPSRKEPVFWDGSIPWLTSGEVRDVVVLDTKEKITPDGLDSSSAKLWPPMTTVVAMYGATAGQVCLLAKEMTANQACCALIPLAEFKAFIFIAARQSTQQLSEKASGSAQQNLNKSLVENHAYVIPTKKIAEKFEKATTTLLQRWIQNQKEITTLGMVRDTLLPKLLSGELRVSNAEHIMEKVWP
ncbi:restriction endonuclease subunit S [Alcaligenaceae bacterium]|nr:restriction endonuclease subunit S [Alcaligenaceae bacterium]